MEELRDIEGLAAISVWPLAVGWWVVIAISFILILIGAYYLFKKYRYRKSWQYQSYSVLQQIENMLNAESISHHNKAKHIIHQLAVEIRRIAMNKSSRDTCAGLSGKEWLNWLERHDPQKFAWQAQGQLLVEYQYMPDAKSLPSQQVKSLVSAAKQWVRRC